MKTNRRYIYNETAKEITQWAQTAIREQRLQERPPNGNGKANFPWYLKQYLLHLKFQARKG